MKLLTHLAPRAGAEGVFAERIHEIACELRERLEPRQLSVTGMIRLPDDPFGAHTPHRAALEIAGEAATPELLAGLLAGLGPRIDPFAHPDLCTALVGSDHVFIDPGGAPVRYQYLMRRNACFDHDAYLERYRVVHSRFGIETPGIVGYVQFHVDPVASQQVAAAAGLGCWNVDSVSELHLESLESFLVAVAKSGIAARAIEDEERFVDRANSLDFCSRVGTQAAR
jgi:hypothetical protein